MNPIAVILNGARRTEEYADRICANPNLEIFSHAQHLSRLLFVGVTRSSLALSKIVIARRSLRRRGNLITSNDVKSDLEILVLTKNSGT